MMRRALGWTILLPLLVLMLLRWAMGGVARFATARGQSQATSPRKVLGLHLSPDELNSLRPNLRETLRLHRISSRWGVHKPLDDSPNALDCNLNVIGFSHAASIDWILFAKLSFLSSGPLNLAPVALQRGQQVGRVVASGACRPGKRGR
jgi:hypothetical protein